MESLYYGIDINYIMESILWNRYRVIFQINSYLIVKFIDLAQTLLFEVKLIKDKVN
jgi:hypothetical protein